MDNRPIGVFDSGIGGLTAVKEIKRILPNEDIVYFGDTARVPYGSHSAGVIQEFAKQDLAFLLSKNVKAVLVACGTVSSTALSVLRMMTNIPIIGVISEASRKAAENSKNVVVLATNATITSHAYKNEICTINKKINVQEKACPLFVPLIENGYASVNNPVTEMVVRDYVQEFADQKIDSVILGCTHYPLLKEAIRKVLPDAAIIEAGKEAICELAVALERLELRADTCRIGKRKYYVSDMTDAFMSTCELLLEEDIKEEIFVQKFEK